MTTDIVSLSKYFIKFTFVDYSDGAKYGSPEYKMFKNGDIC